MFQAKKIIVYKYSFSKEKGIHQGFPTFYQPHTTKRAKKMFAYHQIFSGEMKLMKHTQEKSVLGHLTLLIKVIIEK
jgi:hypothetical protein